MYFLDNASATKGVASVMRRAVQWHGPCSKREDGTFSREDFAFDKERNVYICPASNILTTTAKVATDGETPYYRARTRDCRSCPLKSQCCPKARLRRIPRSIYEEAVT